MSTVRRGREWLALALCTALLTGCSASFAQRSRGRELFRGHRYNMMAYGVALDDYEAEGTPEGIATDRALDADGWGAEFEALGTGPSLIVGYQDRTFDERIHSEEVYVGLKLYLGEQRVCPYVTAVARWLPGLELEETLFGPALEADDNWGWGAGGGLVVQITDNLYLDGRVLYEATFDDYDLGVGEPLELDGWIGLLGAGFSF